MGKIRTQNTAIRSHKKKLHPQFGHHRLHDSRRNNLTVFDMKIVQGHGAKELLRVGGKLPGPGASLRFNVPQSTLMECRDGETHV